MSLAWCAQKINHLSTAVGPSPFTDIPAHLSLSGCHFSWLVLLVLLRLSQLCYRGGAIPSAIHTLHCLSCRGTFSSLQCHAKEKPHDSAAVPHIKTEPATQQVTDVLIIPPQAELLYTPAPLQLNEIIRGGHTSHTHRFDKNTEAFCFRHASDT